MRKGKRGVLTVFVSLILVLVLSFVCTIVEAVRVTGGKMQAQAVADSAMDSLFSEYHRRLMDCYHLFFISGVYDKGMFSPENLTERMQEYMVFNLEPESAHVLLQNTDFWRLKIRECNLDSFRTATDKNCRAYRQQAADCVKGSIGQKTLEKLLSWEETSLDPEVLEQSLQEREEKSDRQIKEQEELLRQENNSEAGSSTVQKTESNVFNPITIIKELKEKGILQLVMPDPGMLSEKSISKEGLLSGRTLMAGTGSTTFEGALEQHVEKVLFHEYLMTSFSNALKDKNIPLPEGTALSYELEYILAGKTEDIENLKSVIHRLLLIREAANFAYLMTDSVKQIQAEAVAIAITGLVGAAPFSEAVKYGILLAWAYGESILDVRNLMAGGTVALVKTDETWALELENIADLVSGGFETGREQKGGLGYEDYLRLLLFGEDEQRITLRSLDLIEQNMRLQPQDAGFMADALIADAAVSVVLQTQPLFFSFGFMDKYANPMKLTVHAGGSYLK